MPGVLDLQVGLGKRDDAVLGPLVVGRRGIVDERAGEQDVRVGDPAAEGPPPGDDDAPVDRSRLTPRRPHARGHPPPPAEELVARLRGEIGDEQAAGDRNRDAPPRRRVAAGDLLGTPEGHAWLELQTVRLDRRARAQQARRVQWREKLVGKLPVELDPVGNLARRLGDLPGHCLDVGVTRS